MDSAHGPPHSVPDSILDRTRPHAAAHNHLWPKAGVCAFSLSIVSLALLAANYAWAQLVSPRLECRPAMLDLGLIQPIERPIATFVIRNRGWKKLVVEDVIPGCGTCVKVLSRREIELAAGESAQIRVQLIASKVKGRAVKGIRVLSNDPLQPTVNLKLQAVVAETMSSSH